MAQIIASAQIETGPEPIWALLCDPKRYPEIADPTEQMIDVPDGEFGAATSTRSTAASNPS